MSGVRPGLPKPVPTPWQQPIATYLEAEAAAGRPRTTLVTRKAHLERTARAMRCAPADVKPAKLISWFSAQTEWAPETRRGYRTTLRSFFTWAHQAGVTTSNPAAALPRVKAVKPAPRPAPDLAWRVALASADRRTTLMIKLAGEAGMRRAEIARIHTRDLTNGSYGPQLLVHGKGNKERIVPISEDLASMIRRGAAGHTAGAPPAGWLFPGDEGGHLSARWVGKLMTRVLPDDWTAHTLRHRFATRAYRGTRNLRAVQLLLGHESVKTTEIYTAVEDYEMRAAAACAW